VVTRKQLRDAREDRPLADICRRPAIAVGESSPLPRVRDVMAAEDIGRLLVTDQAGKLVGIITRSDVFRARSTSLDAETKREIKFSFRRLKA
jgi:predicted transcriptional regulator